MKDKKQKDTTKGLEKNTIESPKKESASVKNARSCKKSIFDSKKLMLCLIGGICLVILLAVMISFFVIKGNAIKADAKTNITLEVAQVDKEQKALVSWTADKSIEALEIKVKHNGDEMFVTTIRNALILANKKIEIPVSYGRYTIEATPIRNGIRSETKSKVAELSTDEYVIAPLYATMPITYFTLQLDTITRNYTIPTFVWFTRGASWNYSAMPENVYVMPVAEADRVEEFTSLKVIYHKTALWVKELYEINPEAKFHFYYNDIVANGLIDATVGNDLPASSYDAVLITDGTGTYSKFNAHFENATDISAIEKEMRDNYSKLKQEVKDHGYINDLGNNYTFCLDDEAFFGYAYTMVQEETNVTWWITRFSGTMANNMQQKLNDLCGAGKLKTLSINSLLPTTEDEINKLKKLYNFSDTYFEKAKTENKKAMVFLGTRTESEDDFETYVKIMKNYYGDQYVYYYKGHPATPTNLDSNKRALLEKMDLIDVDSAVAAELILLFNPEVLVAGYNSSTYLSVPKNQCLALVGKRYDETTSTYKENFDFYCYKPNSVDEALYGDIAKGTNLFVLKFLSNEKYDIAIYNTSTGTMKYYKDFGGTYTEVEK